MTRRRRGKRIFIGFVVVLAIMAGLIAWAGLLLRQPPEIIAPESPEEAAMRTSRDNALYALEEAAKLIPAKPPVLRVATQYNPNEPYQPEEGSIGKVLEIWRPDDDPMMIQYLEDSAPAIAMLEQALDRPFFRRPAILPFWESYSDDRKSALSVYALRQLLWAQARYQAEMKHNPDRALALQVDQIRLAHMVSSDGGYIYYGRQNASYSEVTPQLDNLLQTHAVSVDALRAALTKLETLPGTLQSPEQVALFALRSYSLAATHELPTGDLLQKLYGSYHIKKMLRFFAENRDQILAVARMDDCDALAPTTKMPTFADPRVPDARSIEGSHRVHATAITELNRLMLMVTLELYYQEHGRYPDSLDQVAAAYPDTPTTDGFCGHAFDYTLRPDADAYALDVSQATLDMGFPRW